MHVLRIQDTFFKIFALKNIPYSIRVKLCFELATWLHMYHRNIYIVRRRESYIFKHQHNGDRTIKSLKVHLVWK